MSQNSTQEGGRTVWLAFHFDKPLPVCGSTERSALEQLGRHLLPLTVAADSNVLLDIGRAATRAPNNFHLVTVTIPTDAKEARS